MKILYWTPQFWPEIGGLQTLAMQTLPVLAENGYEFMIVTSHGRTKQPDQDEYRGLPIQRFPFWSALVNNDVALILELQKQIVELKRTFAPDLIHINFSGYTAYFQQATARVLPTPTVIALHGDPNSLKVGLGTITGRLFQGANWVTAVSNAILAEVRRLVPELSRRSSMIYGCIAPPSLATAHLPVEQPCLIGIGRLVREKGFDILLEALPFILAKIPNISVKLIGDGEERRTLEQLASSLGLKKIVEFKGSLSNSKVLSIINTASLVVVPSRYLEAFGIVAVEAAWMARPVVATNVGGLAEIVVDGQTGRLVKMEDPEDLARAVIDLLANPDKAARMGQAARLRAQEKFSMENYIRAYDSLYQHVAEDVQIH